jgi:hypothetical protein
VGARTIRKRDLSADRRRDARAIALVFAAILGPLLLTYLLIAADMRSDLSELKPWHAVAEGGVRIVGWADLAADGTSRADKRAVHLANSPVRMLGYMMDWYRPVREGTPVSMFILMPEAGHLLHPAHRIPSQMVEIRLASGHSIPYRDRRLIWVTGLLENTGGTVNGEHAVYAMTGASTAFAEDRDIARWFVP